MSQDQPAPGAAEKPTNWNLPNALTTLRIIMVPIFGWALLIDGGDSVLWRTVAWAIFVAAMVTDKVDGDIARSRNLVTDFGKIADPIADKALTGMAFVGLSIIGELWWWVTVIVLLREWGITLLRLWVMRYGVMAAGSRGAAAFAAWRSALTVRICAEPVLAPLLDDLVHGGGRPARRRRARGWPSTTAPSRCARRPTAACRARGGRDWGTPAWPCRAGRRWYRPSPRRQRRRRVPGASCALPARRPT